MKREKRTKHGHRRSIGFSPTYNSWRAMKERCLNPAFKKYKDYGGRGITVCERWLKFENFLADMGERPQGTTIDRLNNDGSYEPGNCKWRTPAEQAMNQRPIRRNNTSGFKGVSYHLGTKKYIAYIQVNRKRVHLGLRATAEEAHVLYMEAAERLVS